jgi:glycerol-3-phosphate cytidylyltransferase-like family protein
MTKKKVFVSGCFDMLHSGHIRFLEKAANPDFAVWGS